MRSRQLQAGAANIVGREHATRREHVLLELEREAKRGRDLPGLTFTIKSLDIATTGIREGQLVILGGRSGEAGGLALGATGKHIEIDLGRGATASSLRLSGCETTTRNGLARDYCNLT